MSKFRELSDEVFAVNARGAKIRKMNARFEGSLTVWINTAKTQIDKGMQAEGLQSLAEALEGAAHRLRKEANVAKDAKIAAEKTAGVTASKRNAKGE